MQKYVNRCQQILSLLAAGVLTSLSQTAWSAGFQSQEQSALFAGLAYAGTGAMADDATTVFYNSAGMTHIHNEQIVLSATQTFSDLTLTGTSVTNNNATPVALGSGIDKPKAGIFVPSVFYTNKINSNWYWGIGVTSPFALRTKYDDNSSFARYKATRSEIRTMSITPSIAYDCDNGLSLGAGLDAMYVLTKLDTALNFSLANLAILNVTDGYLEQTMSDWGWGAHVGALYEVNDHTRFGLQYRSSVSLNSTGTAIAQTAGSSSGIVPVPTAIRVVGVQSKMRLPDSVLFSAYHDLSDRWAALFDLQWVHWNVFKEIKTHYSDPPFTIGNPVRTLAQPQHYKNTYRVALGSAYKYDQQWTFRMGVAYDKSPVQDNRRIARIPDSDRVWLGLGTGYRWNKHFSLDIGYAHLFCKKATINEPGNVINNGTTGSATLVGRYRQSANVVGVQLRWDIV